MIDPQIAEALKQAIKKKTPTFYKKTDRVFGDSLGVKIQGRQIHLPVQRSPVSTTRIIR